MSLRLVLEANDKVFAQQLRDLQKPIAKAITRAMKDVGALAKTGWKAAIAAGGMGAKFQGGVSMRVYPSSGISLSPAAQLKHHIPYANVFQEGATILPVKGKFLWLPLPTVPVISGGRRLPAGKYRERIGFPLYTIRRPGKPPLLGANIRATGPRFLKGISLSQLKRGRNPGGRGTVRLVPLYVGVPTVTDPKKFDVISVGRDAASQLGALYVKHLQAD